MTTRRSPPDPLRGLTPEKVDRFAVPYGMRVIALAKIVRQLIRVLKLLILCLTIIVSSSLGLGLLVITAGHPTFVKKTLIRLIDEWRVKDQNFTLEPLDSSVLPSLPD